MQSSTLLSAVIFMPLLGAALLMLVPRGERSLLFGSAITISLITFALSLGLWFGFNPEGPAYQFESTTSGEGWLSSIGASYHIGLDGVSLALVILSTFLMPIIFLSSLSSIEKRIKEFVIAFLILETAMIGTLAALDLVLFYIFWEAMLFPMYLLIGVWGGDQRVYATVKFFLYTMVGSVLMLIAILYMHYATGMQSFDYSDFMLLARSGRLEGAESYLFWAFALAFAIKVPMFPLHTWLPDAHVQAPTTGSVVLAGVLLKMGTYGFYRFAIPMFPNAAVEFAPLIAWLSVIGIIYGAMIAWVQSDVKKLVAYSSVSHLGFVMLGLVAGSEQATAGAVMQMINHGLSTPALFLCVGVIYERRHTRKIDEFGGLAKEMPVYTVVFAMSMLSSIGLPGLNGFVGEFLVLAGTFLGKTKSLIDSTGTITALAATGVILGAVYMLTMFQKVMFGPVKNPKNRGLPDLTWREIFVFAPLIVSFVVLGFYPKLVLSRIEGSVSAYTKALVEPVKAPTLGLNEVNP